MNLQNKTDNILNSLDGIQKASPGQFFFTRVRARIAVSEGSGIWSRAAAFLARPTVALSTLVLICLLNTAAFFYEKKVSASAEQTEQLSAEDYNTTVVSNSYYNENTEVH